MGKMITEGKWPELVLDNGIQYGEGYNDANCHLILDLDPILQKFKNARTLTEYKGATDELTQFLQQRNDLSGFTVGYDHYEHYKEHYGLK